MTTTQTKWWWPICKPWEIKQSFKQKMCVVSLFGVYFVIAILSSWSETTIFGEPSRCLPTIQNATQTQIEACHTYDLDKDLCERDNCYMDSDYIVGVAIIFAWGLSLCMFIGCFRIILWPALQGYKLRRPAVVTPAITPMEYDAL